MARLIPSCLDDRTPPGEREVFNLLASGPEHWVVVHSLDLSPWNRGLRTEIDFLIIVPDAGILCIEVKSHERISYDGSSWTPATISRSPFKQAADGRYTFQRRLSDRAPNFSDLPVVHCCIFPRATFTLTPNLSVQPWELMDSACFRAFTNADLFCSDLRTRLLRSIEADARLTPLRQPLSRGHVDSIVALCVPVQRWRPGDREEIQRREREIEGVLREQQRPVLDFATWNARVVVSGAAGTGKTLIAFEVARRAAESGRRVALLCYNHLVGEWIKRQCEAATPMMPNLIAGRAIQVLAEMSGISIPSEPSQEFWDVELPRRLEDRLTDPEFNATASMDYLVLDEAQDILARPLLWQCLTQFLAGGPTAGAYALFGDFDHQVLGARAKMHQSLAELADCGRPGRWRLSENCRNYRVIGETATRLSGMGNEVYSGYRRPSGSANNYEIQFYEHDTQQLDTIGRWLKEIKAQGYRTSETTLLSFRADHLSAASRLKGAGFRLRPVWQGGEATAYASIHAFKGLENKNVILTDVALGNHDTDRDLFYVGMTRATESVRVLCDSQSKAIIMAWLARRSLV
ncbi:MAG: NERD domain-containing protein [Candidatus Eisenbacteria bacterium]